MVEESTSPHSFIEISSSTLVFVVSYWSLCCTLVVCSSIEVSFFVLFFNLWAGSPRGCAVVSLPLA